MKEFNQLVKGLRTANQTHIHDKTLTVVLDHAEGVTNAFLVSLYMKLLLDICKAHNIHPDRVMGEQS